MESLAEKIRRQALAIGFHKIGFARAEALSSQAENLREWLDKDFQGEMQWMAREPEKRTDPKLIFPDAKTVVSVALNYFTPHEHEENSNTGKVSRYAWGDDYHDVLKEKLRELLAFIQSLDAGVEGKICVDTVPVAEKTWAQRAGLGWIGKHSNLITGEYGSWVFLGEILLDVEIETDARIEPDHCGSCTACLDACPTNAIVAPYVVDSRRCISYATIELRASEIPSAIGENLNGWLYGCDICQDVCPWNRFEKPTEEARFEPRPGNVSADLQEISALTDEKFAARFRRSAMKRTKISGLRRNARQLINNAEAEAGNADFPPDSV